MRIATVVSPLLGAVCHLVADARGRCVVVDPGAGVVDDVAAVAAREGWTPVAALLTHGHLDHTWDAAAVADRWDVPVHVHAGDAYRLADPVGSLGPLGAQLAATTGLDAPPTPRDLRPFDAPPGEEVQVALGHPDDPLVVVALHSPGHTQGSTVYLVPEGDGATALTGDVLFAGGVGRTDLPGGDDGAMSRSLARLAALEPTMRVRPAHGPTSTVERELATNPWLRARRA